jgi:histidinol-phosphate/aromatic aminotransferase/cobyric acid decarboxylase-like protein
VTYVYLVLVLAAVLAIARIAIALRRARDHQQDWDARLVQDLRAAGGNAFTPYEVDFFFGLPDEAACDVLRGVLEPEGFAIDARVAVGEAASGYSLHARKQLRISVTEMQEHSKRFRVLAEQLGGHYDGWMTDPSRK